MGEPTLPEEPLDRENLFVQITQSLNVDVVREHVRLLQILEGEVKTLQQNIQISQQLLGMVQQKRRHAITEQEQTNHAIRKEISAALIEQERLRSEVTKFTVLRDRLLEENSRSKKDTVPKSMSSNVRTRCVGSRPRNSTVSLNSKTPSKQKTVSRRFPFLDAKQRTSGMELVRGKEHVMNTSQATDVPYREPFRRSMSSSPSQRLETPQRSRKIIASPSSKRLITVKTISASPLTAAMRSKTIPFTHLTLSSEKVEAPKAERLSSTRCTSFTPTRTVPVRSPGMKQKCPASLFRPLPSTVHEVENARSRKEIHERSTSSKNRDQRNSAVLSPRIPTKCFASLPTNIIFTRTATSTAIANRLLYKRSQSLLRPNEIVREYPSRHNFTEEVSICHPMPRLYVKTKAC